MRVLVLSNFYPPDVMGGYEVACAQATDGLLARGHDVRVLSATPRQPVVGDPPHVRRRFVLAEEWNENVMGDLAITHLLTHAASRFVSAHNIHVLSAELAEFDPEVVYLHNLVGLGGLGLVACLGHLGVPWVWQLGDAVPVRLCASRTSGVIRPLAAEMSRWMRGHVIAVSDHVRREVEAFGVPILGPVERVPYWIVGRRPRPRRNFYQGGTLRVVSAGQINSDKGVDILIEAAALLHASGAGPFEVDVYGKVLDPYYPARVRALGLDGVVKFRGPRPNAELLELYEDYDLLVFPTQPREPFGLVALEAAARGCVPLMTRDCGVAEWLVHGVHCLKAERSAPAFARAMREVIEGRVSLGPIGRRASAAAWDDFHLDAVLPRIERVLHAAAASAEGRPSPDPRLAAEVVRLGRLAETLTRRLVEESVPA
ncbi:MAG: glycosyltransferase family 4 protein [Isosphaeraceae bacterium]